MKRSSIARRDPLYASLTDQQRPERVRFYDGSEVDALSSFMWAALGEQGKSEYCLHRTLAAIPEGMIRNKALYTAHLSLAQARQDELELACATGRQALRMLPTLSSSRRTTKTVAATRKALVDSGTKAPEITEWIEESGQWI